MRRQGTPTFRTLKSSLRKTNLDSKTTTQELMLYQASSMTRITEVELDSRLSQKIDSISNLTIRLDLYPPIYILRTRSLEEDL